MPSPLAVGAVFSPDDKLALVLYAQPETGRIWDLERGEERSTSHSDILWPGLAAFLPNSRSVLSAHQVKYPLHLWDANDGHLIRTIGFIDVRADGVTQLALSADGRLALSAHWDTRLKLWDVGTGEQLRVMGESQQFTSAVSAYYVALLPDGKRAMASHGHSDLWLWDVTTGERIGVFKGPPDDSFRVLDLSADGRSALYGGALGLLKEPFPVILWDVPAEKEVARFVGHKAVISNTAFIPNEARILSGSNDGVLKCWDIRSQKEVWSFDSGYPNTKYAFSADRKLALTVNQDGALQLVDARQGRLIRKLRGPFKRGEDY
jgi:WD40 repeat protein